MSEKQAGPHILLLSVYWKLVWVCPQETVKKEIILHGELKIVSLSDTAHTDCDSWSWKTIAYIFR